MVLTNRQTVPPYGDPGGLSVGRVSRTSPVFVMLDGREYGPVILTRTAAAATFAVGDQVLVAGSDVDSDRLIVIDGVA